MRPHQGAGRYMCSALSPGGNTVSGDRQRTRTRGRRTLLAVLLTLLVVPSCADRRDTNASTQCEVTVSTQLFRSDQAKIDREVIRRVSRDMRAGREIIWRDAYFHGQRLSRTKVLCLDLPSGGLAFRVLERHRD